MANVVSFNLDAALVEGVLSKGMRRVTCHEVMDAAPIPTAPRPPHLVLLAGDARTAADFAEGLLEDPMGSGAPVVAWRLTGDLADIARLVALGVRVAEGDEDALRCVCDEMLDVREDRTRRVDAPVALEGASDPVLELHGRRVIVADDDPAITWFFSDLLRAQGCDVEEVGDGALALNRARRTMPDLIVSDIRMPRLDGPRLCRILRADPILADVPILLLSWKEDWLAEAQQGGVEASAYLAKRSTPEEVLGRVLEVLGPIARFERLLRQAGSIKGQLDGAAPHRLLRLACASHPDGRLSVRCAPNAYEVQVRGGVPRKALCILPDGTAMRGVAALEALLAERAGRFTLTPEHGPVDGELLGTLHQQIAGYVARVRRATLPLAAVVVPVSAQPAPAAAAPEPAPRAPTGAHAQESPSVLPALVCEPGTAPLAPVAALTAARPRTERTLPFHRELSMPSIPLSSTVAAGSMDWRRLRLAVPLRWLGVAAVAALGIVLGAGARALRHPPEVGGQAAQVAAPR